MEEILESQRNALNKKVQKIEYEKNEMIDKQEKMFFQEVENRKFNLMKEQINAEKLKSTRALENKIKCISEVTMEVNEKFKKKTFC